MTDAKKINVKSFRLLYQWPLFVVPKDGETDIKSIKSCIDKVKDLLKAGDAGWSPVNPLDYPDFGNKTKDHDGLSPAYGEFLYFHDFVQKFLFPRETDSNPAFTLYQNTRFKSALCEINDGPTTNFKVERHSIHLFESGIAVVTVELSASDLNLGDVMKAMDQMRRSYVPYFSFDEESKKRKAGGVPETVTLRGCKSELVSHPPDEKAAHGFLDKDDRDESELRPTILEHWKAFAVPLKLLGDCGKWRDLSDERLPFNAYISLTSRGDKAEDDRNALLQISDGDWMRLAEVDPPGDALSEYNPKFLETLKDQAFYDRFFPHPESGGNSTRHIFSAAHYTAIGAGRFADNLLLNHWRRHYAHLTLIVRFEQASLLAISSRISQIARSYDDNLEGYEAAILDMREQFATFENRFRFTGVSSQIQPTEMFNKLRNVMGLDVLYLDVKNEIEQAAALVMARQQTRTADNAERLNQLATIGLFLALVVSAAGMNLFIDTDYGFGSPAGLRDNFTRFAVVVGGTAFAFGALLLGLRLEPDRFLRSFLNVLMFLMFGSILAFLFFYLPARMWFYGP